MTRNKIEYGKTTQEDRILNQILVKNPGKGLQSCYVLKRLDGKLLLRQLDCDINMLFKNITVTKLQSYLYNF